MRVLHGVKKQPIGVEMEESKQAVTGASEKGKRGGKCGLCGTREDSPFPFFRRTGLHLCYECWSSARKQSDMDDSSGDESNCSLPDSMVLLQAIEHYGVKNQAGQLMGEMGELAAAVTQHFFQSRDRAKEIAEEIADVQIMLEQMILHLGIEEEVARWRSNKLKRLESRMNQAG